MTAATLLASLPLERLTTPRQVAAYVGLCPRSAARARQSGAGLGPAHLRKALYMPALVAMRANPALRTFTDRLRRAGKRSKVIVVAVMRTLLLLAWAILRSGQSFSPAYQPNRAPAVN